MSDGQDKTDDLISELAKLMSSAGEPEARPGPRPVNVPETPQRPLGIRIPGMDAPVLPNPVPPPPVASPAAPQPPRPAAAPSVQPSALASDTVQSPGQKSFSSPAAAPTATPVIRIPGMDRPVPVTPAEPRTPAESRAPAIDFGPLTPPDVPRPSPIGDWQSRETPKAPAAPAIAREAEPTMPPQAAASAAPAPKPAPNSLEAILAEAAAAVSARAEDALGHREPVPGKPRSADDSFGFDLSFLNDPEEPEPAEMPAAAPRAAPPAAPAVAAAPRPVTASPASAPGPIERAEPVRPAAPAPASAAAPASPAAPAAPSVSLGDPIADLIAAELDAVDLRTSPESLRGAAERAEPVSAPRPTAPAAVAETRPRPPTAPRPALPAAARPSAPPSAESDRFGVAPMFTPATRAPRPDSAATPVAAPVSSPPVAAAPTPAPIPAPSPVAPVERDPMDEIESLIGEAVRVEMAQQAPVASPPPAAVASPAPAPSAPSSPPVVPPLNSGFAPRRAALKDSEPKLGGVEPPIGAPPSKEADLPRTAALPPLEARPKAKPERSGVLSGGMRQLIGIGVAAALLLVAGLGLFWVLNSTRSGDGVAPVLEADSTPVKEAPPATATPTDSQGSVVFNELNGTTDTSNEQLVSRDESSDTTIADLTSEDGAATDASSEGELANRKVRTVTVRPDGTIVSGDDAVAGSEALPVDRPEVPALPGGDVQPSELLASVPAADGTEPAAAQPAVAASDAEQQLAALQPSAGNVIDANKAPVVPMPRPTGTRASMDNAGQGGSDPVPPLDIGTPSKSAQTNVVSGGSGTYVQLSSQRSENEAADAMRAVQRKLGGLLNGSRLEIRRVDLGNKGVWYRVVLPTNSFQDATQACATIKANGGDCVPING